MRPEPLSLQTLAQLPDSVRRPSYDPTALQAGIVHIGCGAFHKAHQAVYTEKALAASYGDWGIIGASLRQPQVRDQLRAQDGLYTVLEKSAEGAVATVIGCMRDVMFTPDDPMRLPGLIADARIKLVSVTVTEKGYCHHPASGELDFSHPDIEHDVAHPTAPLSTVGVLVAGLYERRLAHGEALTVLCCDNLPHNGRVLQGLVLAFAQATDPDTAAWIAANITFPSTMVDRIVPATTAATLDEVAQLLGVTDRAAVWGEPFMQWIIEDNFAAGRPLWEAAGAEFVPDVAPYEEMKLRLLNGSHSMLAYLGYLAGYEFVYQVMADPVFFSMVRGFMAQEAAPTLAMPADYDLAGYQAQLLARFSNPYLPHRCYQIAMDGSQKLPQRLLNTVRANLAANRPLRLSALAVAAWMRYVGGIDESGGTIAVQDPLADRLRAAAQGEPSAAVDQLLAVHAIFSDDLPRNARFRAELIGALASLRNVGSRRTAADWMEAGE